MFGNNDARVIPDGGKNGETGTDDGTETTGSGDTDHTPEDGYHFRLGGLSLDLSGVEADIDGLTLGLDAVELGVSKTGGSNAEESGSRLRSVRNLTPKNDRSGRFGARVGAFVGRLVGSLVTFCRVRISTAVGRTSFSPTQIRTGRRIDGIERRG
ncbi:hypothetical protein [Haladaptatus cibarius]|uniref:hypothetical protein n=1 Tax=Haladaptatus cibarius TaxID=453847 RepID=UPI00067957DF|nr:hypothetical protein [Haladaptatus cibarius]